MSISIRSGDEESNDLNSNEDKFDITADEAEGHSE
jgi:hypothetical protein